LLAKITSFFQQSFEPMRRNDLEKQYPSFSWISKYYAMADLAVLCPCPSSALAQQVNAKSVGLFRNL